ncbi:hypothetical protein ABK040_009679 [Willaertia magna]
MLSTSDPLTIAPSTTTNSNNGTATNQNQQQQPKVASRGRSIVHQYKNEDNNNEQDITNNNEENNNEQLENKEKLITYIRESIIGDDEVFKGPFGFRKITYCDYVASGRSLSFIEEYIKKHVLTMYANTHTTTSITGLQSTLFRYESRDIIRNATNCSKKDVLIFCGSGSTSGFNKLVHLLGLQSTSSRDTSSHVTEEKDEEILEETQPIVFLSPMEHHSNILPWRESNAKVITIKLTKYGQLDINDLEYQLKKFNNKKRLLIGSFTAASNITGILELNINKISALMHRYGGYVIWDYAAAGPYVEIDMNPKSINTLHNIVPHDDDNKMIEQLTTEELSLIYKDAIVISPHKFIGGVQTPGILILKKHLIKNNKPQHPGGGSVFYVTEKDHQYLKKAFEREESGTPEIIGSIRAGLCFQLKQSVGIDFIIKKERELTNLFFKHFEKNENIIILGTNKYIPRLPIFSFLIKHHSSYLHSNFISILLNDLFGIQCRSGCACSGPFGQFLLGLNVEQSKEFHYLLLKEDDYEYLRPGFVRLNLNYFMDDTTLNFILNAITFISKYGYLFLPYYYFYPETGEWLHLNNKKFPHRRWLSNVTYKNGKMEVRQDVTFKVNDKKEVEKNFNKYLEEAEMLKENAIKEWSKRSLVSDYQNKLLDEYAEGYRWFIYPNQVIREVQGGNVKDIYGKSIFNPIQFDTIVMNNTTTIMNDNTTTTIVMNEDDNMVKKEEKKEEEENLLNDISIEENNLFEWVHPHERNASDPHPKPQISSKLVDSILNKENEETENRLKRKAKFKLWPKLNPKTLIVPVKHAIKEFNMIQDGDRLLLGLSGGKDSMTLLHILHALQLSNLGIKFEIGACTVDPQTTSYDPSPLKNYLKMLGVPYFFESQSVIEGAKECGASSICSWCSRMKRGILYNVARREGYNVLVLGQHLDDLAESFIMSIFHNGFIRTMKANYTIDAGDLRVIRPLIYVREADTKKFCMENGLPVINENCPACFEIPKERHRIKNLLATQEHLFPNLYSSLQTAMKPLLEKDIEVEGHKKFKSSVPTNNNRRKLDDFNTDDDYKPQQQQSTTSTSSTNGGDSNIITNNEDINTSSNKDLIVLESLLEKVDISLLEQILEKKRNVNK